MSSMEDHSSMKNDRSRDVINQHNEICHANPAINHVYNTVGEDSLKTGSHISDRLNINENEHNHPLKL